ncbi:MAG TPA: GNAT family protein [Solirubrobacteraceae bacterium]|nr:GNAT family protein [Solirubrobacteraceae bacterium]
MEVSVPDRLSDGVVALRLMTPTDAPAYARAFREDPDLGVLLGFDTDPDEAEASRSLAGVQERASLGQAVEFAIVAERDAALLGSVLVFQFHRRHRRCEVGFWVARHARRTGVGRRAVALAIDWAFDGVGVERIEMTTTPENPVIPSFARSLGFAYEGCLRGRNLERGARVDTLHFGLLRDEWPPAGPA